MALDRREPATFAALYAPNGDEFRYKMSAATQAARQLDEEWMGWLRQQAGLETDWVPPDEAKGKSPAEDRGSRRRADASVRRDPARSLSHRVPATIRQIQATGQVNEQTDGRRVGPARRSRPAARGASGPNSRKPSATTIGTSPNKSTSPSLNSCSRAGMTNRCRARSSSSRSTARPSSAQVCEPAPARRRDPRLRPSAGRAAAAQQDDRPAHRQAEPEIERRSPAR